MGSSSSYILRELAYTNDEANLLNMKNALKIKKNNKKYANLMKKIRKEKYTKVSKYQNSHLLIMKMQIKTTKDFPLSRLVKV